MLLSTRNRFIFFRVYKTGSSSIRDALSTHANYESRNPHFQVKEFVRSTYPWAEQLYRDYFTFAVVRNPWDWLVSMYHYIKGRKQHHKHDRVKNLTFAQFVQKLSDPDLNICPKHQFMLLSEDGTLDSAISLSFVGRFENLNADFERIRQFIDVAPVSLPHTNRSQHRDYRSYYDDTTTELVAELFKKDVEYFGYEFDGPVTPSVSKPDLRRFVSGVK